MKKLVINISFCLFAVSLLFLNTVYVSAQTFNTETVKPIEDGTATNEPSSQTQENASNPLDIGTSIITSNLTAEDYSDPDNAAQAVISTDMTVEGLFDKIITKVSEIITDGQKLGMILCIGAFIISVMVAVFGALGRKGPMPGIIAAVVSAIAFTCIKYGPEIVASFSAWFIS